MPLAKQSKQKRAWNTPAVDSATRIGVKQVDDASKLDGLSGKQLFGSMGSEHLPMEKALEALEPKKEGGRIVVRPKSTEEVVKCLQEASRAGCSVSVVGGNHSGYARRGDLILEMADFRSVSSEKGLLTLGAGLSLKEIALEAYNRHLAVPLGTAPTVGLGLLLQGGVGHLTRSLGLAMDAVLAFQVVTLQGVLQVSEDSEAELFWALRGCGPNFGVVTGVTLQTSPFRGCDTRAQVFEDCSQLEKYLKWSKELPLECSADCCLWLGLFSRKGAQSSLSSFSSSCSVSFSFFLLFGGGVNFPDALACNGFNRCRGPPLSDRSKGEVARCWSGCWRVLKR